ncbi:PKD domain-containing protein, partial [Polluticaenibacter yanchengensis]|nr:PKD domain-containing protein [Chitinophagaceae bacterium LY-5]
MRRNLFSGFSRYLFLQLLFWVGFFGKAYSQTDITLGTGTTSNTQYAFPTPFPDVSESSRAQYLFRAAELRTAGMNTGTISAIKFNIRAATMAGSVTEGFVVKVGPTQATVLNNTTWAAYSGSIVESSPTDVTHTAGWISFTLNAPLVWNGTDNLIVEVCSGKDGAPFNYANASVYNSNPGFVSSNYNVGNGNGCNMAISGGAAQNNRPNTRFTWKALPECTGTPITGTIVSSVASTCGANAFTLSLNGATLASSLTYQWQSSANNSTWTNINGATNSTYVGTQLASSYYRVIITCTATGASATSAGFQLNATPLISGNLTIDNTLANNTATAFKSFNDAYNNALKCGINGPVVVNVVNTGTDYNEQLIMDAIPGASATNTIVFKGNAAKIKFASSSNTDRGTIILNGTDHVTFDNLKIEASGTSYGYGVHLKNNADSNKIINSTIEALSSATSTSFGGIILTDGSSATFASAKSGTGNLIENNTISGGGVSITVFGTATDPVWYNTIRNNKIINFYQYGIYVSGTAFTKVEGNEFHRLSRMTSPTSVSVIYMTGANLAGLYNRNKIHSIFEAQAETTNAFYAFYTSNSDADLGYENIVSNNLIYNIKSNGQLYAFYNLGSDFIYYYYNTVSFDDLTSVATAPTYGFYNTSLTTVVKFKNNLLSISRNGSGIKYGYYLAETRNNIFDFNNNTFFTNNHPTINVGWAKDKLFKKLADWQTGTNVDLNSNEINPGFKNAGAFDFTPTSAAFADKGIPVPGVTADLNGTTRSATTPDIGAIEYSLPSCNTTFLAGESFSSVGITTCVDRSIVLNLKGNDVGLGLTYQWQSAASTTGTWSNISDPLQAPPHRFTAGNNTLYYRAAVSCNGGTPIYSVPVRIEIGGFFPAGTYTIDKTKPSDPTGTRNFNSFNDAVAALSCGIAGPIIFNVAPNSYNEQIKIGYIQNTSAVNTVTFQSANGVATGTELWFNAEAAANNYTVRMDSTNYFSFKNMTVASVNPTYSRTFDLLNNASYNTFDGLVVRAQNPDITAYGTYGADQTMHTGIHAANNYTGVNLVIKNSKFIKGAKGVYISGPSATEFASKHVIENNTFDSTLHQPIIVQNATYVTIAKNTINLKTDYFKASFGQGVYAIYLSNCDTALNVNNNNIFVTDNDGYSYGIYNTGSNSTTDKVSKIWNNRIVNRGDLTSLTVGIHNQSGDFIDVYNNEISVESSIDGTVNYTYAAGIYSNNIRWGNYYNNTVLNTSPAKGIYNAGLYLDHQYVSTGGFTKFLNNVFVNSKGGPAMFVNYTPEHVFMDYNLYYTPGTVTIKKGPTGGSFNKDYNTMNEYRNDWGVEMNSIFAEPVFTAIDDLRPVLNNNKNWALQGRGIQITGNTADKLGNVRSETLTAGVPDLGAFEFHPTVVPPVLTATPATPVAGQRQAFSFGTDTVTVINWAAGYDVPTKIELQRYSGVLPPGLAAGAQSLYYYIDAKVEGSGNYKYSVTNQFYDSWLNTLPIKSYIKLGTTNTSNVWEAKANSVIDSLNNLIKDTALTAITKFTGLTDGKTPELPVFVTGKDSSVFGTRFWAPYSIHRDMLSSNGQNLNFAITAKEATKVTVSINSTGWTRTYNVPAGGTTVSDFLPRTGNNDARLVFEGLSKRGILIEAEKPVSVKLQMQVGTVATPMYLKSAVLLPTGTYAKEYITLATRQFSGYPEPQVGTSFVNVIADNDNTVVEITPSGDTRGGRKGGQPFTVTLNRGEVYQIQGAYIRMVYRPNSSSYDNAYESFDLSGTKVISKPNSSGNCYPVAVFAGSSGTGIRCVENANGADQFMMQQSYPLQAWGTHYLTTPNVTANVTAAATDINTSERLFNQFRVLVKDPATVVKRNGVVLTGLKQNAFYEFTTRDAEFIEADKPVMVAQLTTYFNDCGNDEYTNPGSSEGFMYLSPINLGLKEVLVYRGNGGINWVNIVIPTVSLPSLTIDGSSTFNITYEHPKYPGYTVVMKRWAAGVGVSTIKADTTFVGLLNIPANVYGYSYNLGYQVPRVAFSNDTYKNVNNIATPTNEYTCVGTQFKPTVYLTAQAATLTWQLSKVAGATPTNDITVNNPVPVRTEVIGFTTYYVYTLDQAISFAAVGTYKIPVSATYFTSAQSCATSVDGEVDVVVVPAPTVDYTVNYTGCINATAQFTGTASTNNGVAVDRWNWNFGDNTTSTVQNPTKQWSTAGTKNVSLNIIAVDGCSAGVTKPIEV